MMYFSDIDPKRTVPVKSFEIIRKKLSQPGASWRIDRLTTYLTDLVCQQNFSRSRSFQILYFRHKMNK